MRDLIGSRAAEINICPFSPSTSLAHLPCVPPYTSPSAPFLSLTAVSQCNTAFRTSAPVPSHSPFPLSSPSCVLPVTGCFRFSSGSLIDADPCLYLHSPARPLRHDSKHAAEKDWGATATARQNLRYRQRIHQESHQKMLIIIRQLRKVPARGFQVLGVRRFSDRSF